MSRMSTRSLSENSSTVSRLRTRSTRKEVSPHSLVLEAAIEDPERSDRIHSERKRDRDSLTIGNQGENQRGNADRCCSNGKDTTQSLITSTLMALSDPEVPKSVVFLILSLDRKTYVDFLFTGTVGGRRLTLPSAVPKETNEGRRSSLFN